ncbi:fibrocystin-L-like [Haliotis rufescens]|uniref:fibrocystin-L-like n=1 Tax=Haliotis rufescens TaxID=6454 RepID=UPI00201F5DFD|nr:fibrocystin-L-like [Haliotis rufescens]
MKIRWKVPLILALIAALGCQLAGAAESSVLYIEPSHGSTNGETRITITGRNFARNLFSFGVGFGHVGNKVQMVSDTTAYECAFHPDGSHETQIMCYTKKMPVGEYKVRVSVDGVDIPAADHCKGSESKCLFKTSSSYTPTLQSVLPITGLPGDMVKLRGKLITDRYGSNMAASSNGKTEKLLRVYLGSENCEVKDLDTDTMFGISLDDSGSSVFGDLLCKHQSTFVSSMNASFIIEGGYGR